LARGSLWARRVCGGVRRLAPAPVLLAAAVIVGCGGQEGVASGATVSVYVAAPLCAGARQALSAAGDRAGSVRLRAVCLPSERRSARLDLATVGANARRATQDSASVAYLETADPAVTKFTNPILEAAEIGWVESSSGDAAMARVLHAISAAETMFLRDAVRESLDGA
jgi:hypothetical protein